MVVSLQYAHHKQLGISYPIGFLRRVFLGLLYFLPILILSTGLGVICLECAESIAHDQCSVYLPCLSVQGYPARTQSLFDPQPSAYPDMFFHLTLLPELFCQSLSL